MSSVTTVMIVGLGFMGLNHYNTLNQVPEAKVVSVVDIDASRLKLIQPDIFTSTKIQEAFEKTKPDIVVIATNTKTHCTVLNELLDLSEKTDKKIAIFAEKPLVANVPEAKEIIARLKKVGYGKNLALTAGYLFPFSPAFEKGLQNLKDKKITKITTAWQKDRMAPKIKNGKSVPAPERPTEGVVKDETTHPLYAIFKILEFTGHEVNKLTIEKSIVKREQNSHPICSRKKQEELYPEGDPTRIPIAEVTYRLDVSGLTVEGFSSFEKAPQLREITVECQDTSTTVFRFDDKEDADWLLIDGREEKFGANKLLLEWMAFLKYFKTQKKPFEIPTLEDMYFDVQLTETLEKGIFPCALFHATQENAHG